MRNPNERTLREMNKHTPGPWQYSVFDDGEKYITGPNGDERIASMDGNEAPDKNGPVLAAAPDLLAACEASLFCQEQWVKTKNGPLAKQLRAAIARAKLHDKTLDKPHDDVQ